MPHLIFSEQKCNLVPLIAAEIEIPYIFKYPSFKRTQPKVRYLIFLCLTAVNHHIATILRPKYLK